MEFCLDDGSSKRLFSLNRTVVLVCTRTGKRDAIFSQCIASVESVECCAAK